MDRLVALRRRSSLYWRWTRRKVRKVLSTPVGIWVGPYEFQTTVGAVLFGILLRSLYGRL
jgi:hypothetical protein